MKLWIARDENGTLELFYEEPYYGTIPGIGDAWKNGDYICKLDSKLFPEVTFENSPQEVELELI